MVEVVETEHALGALSCGGELGHRIRRRVRREDGVGTADLVEPREDLFLIPEVLEHRLDDERRRARSSKREVPAMRRGWRQPSAVKMRRATPSASVRSMIASPRATRSSSRSTRTTSKPSVAIFWAMPLPMFPAPTTARRSNGRSGVVD